MAARRLLGGGPDVSFPSWSFEPAVVVPAVAEANLKSVHALNRSGALPLSLDT